MELQRVIDEFLEYTRLEKCASALTLQAYGSDLRLFARHWEAQELPTRLDRITTPVVRRCLFAMHEARSYKPSTLNRRYDTIRSLFAFAVEQEYIEKNPMQKVRSPKPDKSLPVYLRPDELERLLSMPAHKRWQNWQRDRAILYLLAYTGLRRSELLSLTWDDIRFDDHTIRVMGKGRQERLVPMNSELDCILWEYLQGQLPLRGPSLFYNRNGRPLTRSNHQDLFKKYVRHAGLDPNKITLHKVRHTFATMLLAKGADLRTIQELLGHSELSSTQIYTHTSPARKREAVEGLSGL